MKRVALLAALLCASVAHANVWDDAIRAGHPDPAQDKYDSEMRQGDEHAMLANTRSSTYAEVKNQVTLAITSYRNAATAKPTEGEPYYRIGRLLYWHYLECDDTNSPRSVLCSKRQFNRAKAEDVIAAWDEFEKRAPLDPRLSVGLFNETEILFRRAILRTKLGTKAHLVGAAADYEKLIARSDASEGPGEHVVGNLAETYMMIGRIEEAVETYRVALRGAADTSTWYGFAVALDRDERTQQALEVIQSLGRDNRDQFHVRVIQGATFFVPEGEKFYYFALVDEALGLEDEAIEYWRQYINSGAHPQYQPRARAHLDALLKKKRVRQLPIEPPWRSILR
jgi:tetratricopeptide (TPR) repeat protein